VVPEVSPKKEEGPPLWRRPQGVATKLNRRISRGKKQSRVKNDITSLKERQDAGQKPKISWGWRKQPYWGARGRGPNGTFPQRQK